MLVHVSEASHDLTSCRSQNVFQNSSNLGQKGLTQPWVLQMQKSQPTSLKPPSCRLLVSVNAKNRLEIAICSSYLILRFKSMSIKKEQNSFASTASFNKTLNRNICGLAQLFLVV
jgi:hypothetical protein